MKKIFIGSMALALLIFLSACSPKEKIEYVPVEPERIAKKTTVMVYMEGSNLESEDGSASTNILQMLNAEHSSDYLNVIIQTGASDINYDVPATVPDINETQNHPVKDWTRVQRFQISENGIEFKGDLGIGCSESATPPVMDNCIEMGSSKTVQDFIEYSIDTFPADRYMLVFWDHGGGSIAGYGGGAAKPMQVHDIKVAVDTASKNKNVKLEIVGFDACLMANIEFAYNLRDSVKYLVASEELEPGEGWNYNTILTAIAKNPKMTGAEIGKTIVDSYITHNKNDEILTMSVVNLEKIVAVVDAIEALSQHSLNLFGQDKAKGWISFFNARNNADEFGTDSLNKRYVNDIDLSYFASALEHFGDASYVQYTTNLRNAVLEAVTYSLVQSMHTNSTGLSFWLPFNFGGFPGNALVPEYKRLYGGATVATFSNSYITLLEELINYANTTAPEFSIGTPTVSGVNVEVSIESTLGIDDVILVIDKSADEGFIEPVISKVAEAEYTGNGITFKASAPFDHTVLALNTFPIFSTIDAKVSLTEPGKYYLSIPLYFKESEMSTEDEYIEVVMDAIFDFDNGEGDINITLTVADNGVITQRAEKIELKAGNALVIPTVKVNVTDPGGGFEKAPSGDEIKITDTDINAPDLGLKLMFTDYQGTRKYAFTLRNLLGNTEVSTFFNDSDAAVSSSMKAGNAVDDRSNALAEALSKPFWTEKK